MEVFEDKGRLEKFKQLILDPKQRIPTASFVESIPIKVKDAPELDDDTPFTSHCKPPPLPKTVAGWNS